MSAKICTQMYVVHSFLEQSVRVNEDSRKNTMILEIDGYLKSAPRTYSPTSCLLGSSNQRNEISKRKILRQKTLQVYLHSSSEWWVSQHDNVLRVNIMG